MRALALATLLFSPLALAETIGEVSTVFKWLGPNDKVVVEAFDDPKVEGVTCYLSRAKTGGVSGGLGLAEDRSEASLECLQTGAIRFKGELKDGEEVFKERTSLVFKSMQVVRFHDQKRNTLVYLVYSDRIIEGSPQNSLTAVPIRPWSPHGLCRGRTCPRAVRAGRRQKLANEFAPTGSARHRHLIAVSNINPRQQKTGPWAGSLWNALLRQPGP